MTPTQLATLRQLLSQPTAPFREHYVARFAGEFLDTHGVPWFTDPIGNIVVGVASHRDYRQALAPSPGDPLRLFVAHMDHPGFHGIRWLSERRLRVRWFGGSPVMHLSATPVSLHTVAGAAATGVLRKVAIADHGRAIATADVVLSAEGFEPRQRPAARSVFGAFAFRAPFWTSRGRIYTKAADDLTGVYTILETARQAKRMRRGKEPTNFIGLLTRAEEVGFLGAIGHLQLGWLKRRRRAVVLISLEASRTLPGAVVGRGPVVRLGDRRTVFDPHALKILDEVAQRVLPQRHQRRIMDGGACEASAAIAWDLPAIGISIPLGNYHNQGFEGGPDCRYHEGPAPEFVNIEDIDGLLTLSRSLLRARLPWPDTWAAQRRRFVALFNRHRHQFQDY